MADDTIVSPLEMIEKIQETANRVTICDIEK